MTDRIALVLALILGSLPAQAQEVDRQLHSTPHPSIRLEQDGLELLLEFDEACGAPLQAFLELAEQRLDSPLRYDPAEGADVQIRIIGRQRVRSDQFFQYVQSVLEAYRFIVVPSVEGEGETRFLEVRRSPAAAFKESGGCRAPLVAPERLDDIPSSGLVTTRLVLRHTPARFVADALAGGAKWNVEIVVDPTPRAESLIVTGFGPDVRFVRDVVRIVEARRADHASPGSANTALEAAGGHGRRRGKPTAIRAVSAAARPRTLRGSVPPDASGSDER